MKILLIALGASTFAAPDLAQHTGPPIPSPQAPSASTEPVPSSPQAQPTPQPQTDDHHAGHDTNAMPHQDHTYEPDPHTQHELPRLTPDTQRYPTIYG